MSDYPMIKSRCEIVLRKMDHAHHKETEDALYDLYKQLFNHFYQPPPLGVAVKDVMDLGERLG